MLESAVWYARRSKCTDDYVSVTDTLAFWEKLDEYYDSLPGVLNVTLIALSYCLQVTECHIDVQK